MKNNEETQRYSFQKWEEMLQLRKESGLTVRAWCSEQGISERVYITGSRNSGRLVASWN